MKGFSVPRVILTIIAAIIIFPIVYGVYTSVRGTDVNNPRISSSMKELATEASLYLKNNNSYKGFCLSSEALGAPEQEFARGPLPQISELTNNTISSYTCNDTAEQWAVTVPIGTNKYICIDSVIAKAVDAAMGPRWQSGVTLGLEVSQPLGTGNSCSNLQKLQTIVSG